MTYAEMNKLATSLQRDGYTVVGVGDLNGEWEVRVTGRKQNTSVLQPGDFTLHWVSP